MSSFASKMEFWLFQSDSSSQKGIFHVRSNSKIWSQPKKVWAINAVFLLWGVQYRILGDMLKRTILASLKFQGIYLVYKAGSHQQAELQLCIRINFRRNILRVSPHWEEFGRAKQPNASIYSVSTATSILQWLNPSPTLLCGGKPSRKTFSGKRRSKYKLYAIATRKESED